MEPDLHINERTLACVESRTGRVDMGAEALGTLGRTSHVGQTRVERDVASILNELIRRRVVTTMTGAGHFSATIENELDGKIDLFPFALTSNLDAISQSRDGAMGPAATTILWTAIAMLKTRIVVMGKVLIG